MNFLFATKGTFNAMREGYFGPGMAGTHYQAPETPHPEGLGGKKVVGCLPGKRVKVSENRNAEFGRKGDLDLKMGA